MERPWLSASLPVLDLAVESVEAVRSAARGAGAIGPMAVDRLNLEQVASAFSSDQLLSLGGRRPGGFAPLSGFFEASDGWIRTHGNYPHHAERLARVLGLEALDRGSVAAAVRERTAADVESAAAALGAIAVRVRSEYEWRASEPGRALAGTPLIGTTVRTDQGRRRLAGGPSPLAGVRVFDMTRVIAGPVATRTLALFGAEVLRIDPPTPAEIELQHLDTGQGKRTCVLDLRRNLDVGQALLDEADVVVTGYRPGAIESLGLRMPSGMIHARINAWGDRGPWATRRGFDSIVQAACGIAMIESKDDRTPGALPAQALDHASGYFLAAAIIRALAERGVDGYGRDVVVSLARTAQRLLDAPGRVESPPAPPVPAWTFTHGDLTTAGTAFPGCPDYPAPARPWGRDRPTWARHGIA